MPSNAEVVARLSVRDRAGFSRDMRGAQGDIEGVGGAAEGASSRGQAAMGALKVGVAAVAAAAVAVTAELFRIGSEFDTAYDGIRVGTGATGAALDGLKDDFRAVVSTVPASFEDASIAVADLNTRLGITGEPLQDLAGQMLELSRITGTDISTNIASMTRLFGDWGVTADDIPDTMDAVFRASQATGIGLDQLSSSLVQYGAPLRQLGFGFDEATALLAKFEKEGVNAELVMGGMRQSLGRMARAGEDPIETFGRVVAEIEAAGSAGEANAMALELFGARAGPDMAAAIREGRFAVGDLLDTVANGSETIGAAAADTTDWAETWMVLKNRLKVFVEPAATALFSAVGRGMEWLMAQAPVLIARVRPFFDGIVAAWPQISDAIATAWGYIQPVLRFFGDTIAWQWRNVYVPAFEFIAGVMWPAIAAAVQEAWPHIRDAVVRMRDMIVDVWDNHLTPAWEFWVDTMWPGIQRAIELVWPPIRRRITAFREGLEALGNAATAMRDTMSAVWTAVRDRASSAWNWIRTHVIDPMTSAFEGVGNALSFLPGIGGGTVADTAASSAGPVITTAAPAFSSRPVVGTTSGGSTSTTVGGMTVNLHVSAVDGDSVARLFAANRQTLAEQVAIAVGRARVTA